nr:Fpg/Nei family DNA glycosylase [Acidimicrobiia bacterium]
MPEGDTIHRTAAALRTALVDHKMVRFEAPRLVGVTPRAGRTIERVESKGKHLEIEWDDGVILHTHMRMSGSWHLYRTGESWQRPHHQVRVLIEVDGWVAVCFNAPVVETYRHPDARRHPGLGGLGPDLCRTDADLGRCVQILLAYDDPQASVAEVLLDQRVFCGVGNVYRCEVLWACELSPFAHVGTLAEADAVRLVNVAARLLRANLHHATRV